MAESDKRFKRALADGAKEVESKKLTVEERDAKR